MQISTFAAIEIGSYSINMEIFEISRKYGIRSIDQVRRRMELGKDSYGMGKIGKELVGELCQVLKDYCEIMKGYQVSGCRVCATSPEGGGKCADDPGEGVPGDRSCH